MYRRSSSTCALSVATARCLVWSAGRSAWSSVTLRSNDRSVHILDAVILLRRKTWPHLTPSREDLLIPCRYDHWRPWTALRLGRYRAQEVDSACVIGLRIPTVDQSTINAAATHCGCSAAPAASF